jgi:uncharacterized protein YdeI (YjbR/CyaY-like superfamily)
MTRMPTPHTAHVTPTTRKEWREWLRKHHATASGVWLRFAKKHSGLASPSYNDAVEEALCFGWVDSVMHPVDGTYYKQLFTPRKPKSAWAPSNKARVARLIADGRMTRAGLAAVAIAKENGSWGALDEAQALKVPPELQRALDANADAKRHWPTFTESQRRQFLFFLTSAKRAETRANRIARIVAMAAERITPSMAYDERRLALAAKTTTSKVDRPQRPRRPQRDPGA